MTSKKDAVWVRVEPWPTLPFRCPKCGGEQGMFTRVWQNGVVKMVDSRSQCLACGHGIEIK